LQTTAPEMNCLFSIKEGHFPAINDWKTQLATYQGLHIIYSKQCPWVARMVEEIKETDVVQKVKYANNRVENSC
jgi:hypothetical protein